MNNKGLITYNKAFYKNFKVDFVETHNLKYQKEQKRRLYLQIEESPFPMEYRS